MAYDNPHGLIAAAVIVQTLVLGMIILRFVSHKLEDLKIFTSDYLIVIAAILSTALAIEQIYCMHFHTDFKTTKMASPNHGISHERPHRWSPKLLLTYWTGATTGVFAVRVAPLQKTHPAAAGDFLYRARMVGTSLPLLQTYR
jgi:hypothetical protein